MDEENNINFLLDNLDFDDAWKEPNDLLFPHIENVNTINTDVLLNDAQNLPSSSGIHINNCEMKQEFLDSCQLSAANQQEHNLQQVFATENIRVLLPTAQDSQQIPSSSVLPSPSSLPASETWHGEYGFNVSFGPQEMMTKGVAWTYSKVKDKLYVGKDAPCPINFSANSFMPEGLFIRVMALYTSPKHAADVVTRCANHSIDEKKNGVFEAEHLIRCASSNAVYHIDDLTQHHSVLVPFENPSVGQQYSTYIYKFACFGSCSGGPNRRPLMLIFTLEKNGVVIGRRKLNVKICACPGRDRKTEEEPAMDKNQENHHSHEPKEPSVNLESLTDFPSFTQDVSPFLPKKKHHSSTKKAPYVLSIKDKDAYAYLVQVQKFYEINKLMQQLSPEIVRFLLSHQKKKGGDKK